MNKKNKEPLMLLAYLYLEHFKYEKALNLLKGLFILYPEDNDIRRSLAFACLKTGDYQNALMHAEGSLKADSKLEDQIATHLIKGKALWGLGKEEAARQSLNNASQLSFKIKPKAVKKINPEEEPEA